MKMYLAILSGILMSQMSLAGVDHSGGADGVTIEEGIFSHFAVGDTGFTVTKHPNRTESISVRNLVCKKSGREHFRCSAIDTVANRRISIETSPSFGNFVGVNLAGYDGGPLGTIEYSAHFEIEAIDCVNWWTGPKFKTATKCSYRGIRKAFLAR